MLDRGESVEPLRATFVQTVAASKSEAADMRTSLEAEEVNLVLCNQVCSPKFVIFEETTDCFASSVISEFCTVRALLPTSASSVGVEFRTVRAVLFSVVCAVNKSLGSEAGI